MSAEKTIRAQARATLRGGWLKAIAALVILFASIAFVDCVVSIVILLFSNEDQAEWITVAGEIAAVIIGVVTAWLISPIFNGYVRMFYRASTNNFFEISDLFYYFHKGHYRKAVFINEGFILRMIIPTALAFSPVIIYHIICSSYEPGFPMMSLVGFILVTLSAMITFLWSLRYFLVYIYAVDFEYMSKRELFRNSKMMMRGKTGMVSKLFFSFFPWLLLSMTILPILYTAPYFTQAMCISAKWIARSNTPTMNTQEG